MRVEVNIGGELFVLSNAELRSPLTWVVNSRISVRYIKLSWRDIDSGRNLGGGVYCW